MAHHCVKIRILIRSHTQLYSKKVYEIIDDLMNQIDILIHYDFIAYDKCYYILPSIIYIVMNRYKKKNKKIESKH